MQRSKACLVALSLFALALALIVSALLLTRECERTYLRQAFDRHEPELGIFL